MNIFVLDRDPSIAAMFHNNRHIVKMPLESTQMLCTVLNNSGISTPYKSAHAKHPCTIWAGASRENFEWLCDLGLYLCEEYSFRYKKTHKCASVIEFCLSNKNVVINKPMTPFALAMPDEYKDVDAVKAYRNYYVFAKSHLAEWKLRERPDWYPVLGV